MGAPAIVIASAHHADVLGEAFARYEREYDVRLVRDEATAKATAKELLPTGHQVALFVIDTDHDQDKLYELIGGTRKVVPTARRLIVTHISRFRDDNQTFRHAVAAGKVDALLLMPQGPRDEEFHGAVGEMLNEWNATVATPVVENVRIITPEKDATDARACSTTSAGSACPAGVHHPDSEVGREVMASCPDDEGRWPVVSSLIGWCGHCADRARPGQPALRPTRRHRASTRWSTSSSSAPARPGSPRACTPPARASRRSASRPRPSAARPAPAR